MLRPVCRHTDTKYQLEVKIWEVSGSYENLFQEQLHIRSKEEAYLFLELVKKMIDARFIDTPVTVDEIERMVSFEEGQ